MLIDTHGHVNFNAFKDDADEVLKRALENDTWIIMPGSQYSTSKRAVEIAERYKEKVYAAVGLHPIHLGESREVDTWEVQSAQVERQPWMTFSTRYEIFDYDAYKKLAESKKVVAIGEAGLDYYRIPKNKAKREEAKQLQKEVLRRQIDLALEKNLPFIFHCRVAHDDLIEIITEYQKNTGRKVQGVAHSYTGTIEQAQKLIELGLYIGFNGLIFKNVPAIPDPNKVIASLPLDRIILETDSPYLVPPKAKQERNEPLFVKYVAEKIAQIKGVDAKEAADITTSNAKKLFSL